MALTRDFNETFKARAQSDPAFRRALLMESMELMLSGDWEAGKAVLRDYINATSGFEKLAKAVHQSSKSIMRMFGPSGNPRTQNLLTIVYTLQQKEGLHLYVTDRPKVKLQRSRPATKIRRSPRSVGADR
jgi:DNA-binding phage protein